MTIMAMSVLLHWTRANSFESWYVKAVGVRRGESRSGDWGDRSS